MSYTGTIDCSSFPPYPRASGAVSYLVTYPGKIGGKAGRSVNAGDVLTTVAAVATGNHDTVGCDWTLTPATALTLATAEVDKMAIAGLDLDTAATGTGAQVLANTPTLITPTLGAATATSVAATTFDTNVAAAGVTLAGTTLAADGTDTNIDISITPKGTTGKVVMTIVDINAGTIEATIGGTTPAVGTFTTANATTFDTNVAAAGVTLAGTTLAADGTDTTIDISITPKGVTGKVVLPIADIDGGTIDAATIGGGTPAAGTFTTLIGATMTLPEATPVNAAAASGTLTSDATAPTDGKTVTIGSTVYTFKDTLGTTEGQVFTNTTAGNALINLKRAIDHTGTPGTDYYCADYHPTVAGSTIAATTLLVVTKIKGAGANSVVTLADADHLAWGAGTLASGVDGTTALANQTCADATYLYHSVAANTIADTNWRRVALGSVY